MEAALELLNDEMFVEAIENVEAEESLIKKEVDAMDDFEKMVLMAASSATAIIEKNKMEKVDGIDIEAVAASIIGRDSDEKFAKKLVSDGIAVPKKEKKKREPKAPGEKKPRDLVVKNEDKFGSAVERMEQPLFSAGINTDGECYLINTNDIKTIKSQLKEIKTLAKTNVFQIYIVSGYFYTKFHKMELTEPLQIESIGMKYINLSFAGDEWAISPERQDSGFTLRVVPVITEPVVKE